MRQTYAVIMAGGGGTRMWPISRKKHPKHVLPLLGAETLFQSTINRLEGMVPKERILVVTTREQADLLKQQAPQIPAENYLIEPQPRGTAAVVGLAAKILKLRDPKAMMLVLPADHLIRNHDLFYLIMQAAVQVASEGFLVTLGIKPTSPSTGYGYIQQGELLAVKPDYPAYRVVRFTEKPDEEKARQMLAKGDHSWNSGMFIWSAERILTEITRLMPELASVLEKVTQGQGSPGQMDLIEKDWLDLPSVPIDYSVMEKAENVAVLPAGGLEWSDIGSWDALFDVLPADVHGNVVINSDAVQLETHNSLVYSSGKKLIVTIGVNDLVVVDAGDALLICHRDQTQQVRQAIEQLKKTKRDRYL